MIIIITSLRSPSNYHIFSTINILVTHHVHKTARTDDQLANVSSEIQFGLTHNYVSQMNLGLTILDQENIKLMKIVEIDHEN